MTILAPIELPVARFDCGASATGNAVPILHEIRHALSKLLECGAETVIDLLSMPMGPGDEARIFDALGRGEVEANLRVLGASTIRETRFSGVWLVEHRNEADEPIACFIEVTHVPSILKSQTQDIQRGLEELTQELPAGGKVWG